MVNAGQALKSNKGPITLFVYNTYFIFTQNCVPGPILEGIFNWLILFTYIRLIFNVQSRIDGLASVNSPTVY
jgi:hypothetical protein